MQNQAMHFITTLPLVIFKLWILIFFPTKLWLNWLFNHDWSQWLKLRSMNTLFHFTPDTWFSQASRSGPHHPIPVKQLPDSIPEVAHQWERRQPAVKECRRRFVWERTVTIMSWLYPLTTWVTGSELWALAWWAFSRKTLLFYFCSFSCDCRSSLP